MTLLAFVAALLARMKLTPATILCGSWASVFILQAIFASDMYSSPKATAVIFIISSSFVVGELFGRSISVGFLPRGIKTQSRFIDFNIKKIHKRFGMMVVLFGVLSILGAMAYMRALGLFEATSIGEGIRLTGAIREKIFSEEIQVGLIDRIGFLISYSGVVVSISYWYFYGWRWWLILSTIGVVLSGIAQAGRAGTLIVLLQWVIIVMFKNNNFSRFLLKSVVFSSLFLVLFVAGQFLREGFSNVGIDSIWKVIASFRSYLFGGVSAFAVYIDTLLDLTSLTYGRYSFSSLFAVLGIYPQEPGVYNQYVTISNAGDFTNLFTAYRSFVDDFTILGASLFYFISGVILGFLYFNFKKGDTRLISVLIPSISWLAFSPLYSLTYFNSFLLSVILPYFIITRVARG